MKIDFVVAWVDGSDLAWRKQRAQYMGLEEPDAGEDRYRDMGILRYWFRAVEAYAPWVNKVHFITWGHLPAWLDTACPKLNIVTHEDYIPKQYLPVFSSHPIELNLHRVPGLSEQFVYFNDDMLLNGPVGPEFFFRNGLPCDFAHSNNIFFQDTNDVYAHVMTNDIACMNREFSYSGSVMRHPLHYINVRYPLKNNIKNILKLENGTLFAGLEDHHLAAAYQKKTLEEQWLATPDVLDRVCKNRFRTPFDVNQYVFRYRQLAQGRFSPVSKASRGKLVRIDGDMDVILGAIGDERNKMICINDTPEQVDFERAKEQIAAAYERKLPTKSIFEK